MINRADWIQKIGAKFFKKTEEPIESYIDHITTPGVPLDNIALLAIARMYRMHIGVFTLGGIWSTCNQNSLKKVRFALVWKEKGLQETVTVGRSDAYNVWLAKQASDKVMPSHQRDHIPGIVKREKPRFPVFPPLPLKVEKTDGELSENKEAHTVPATEVVSTRDEVLDVEQSENNEEGIE